LNLKSLKRIDVGGDRWCYVYCLLYEIIKPIKLVIWKITW